MNAFRVLIDAFRTFVTVLLLYYKIPKLTETDSESGDSKSNDSKSGDVWICQAVEDPVSFTRIYYYLKASLLSGKKPKIVWLNTHLNFRYNRDRFKSRVMDFFTQNYVTILPWKRLYLKIWNGSWNSLHHVKVGTRSWQMAEQIHSTISGKKDLEKLRIQNVWVGDLIYDTYLRFKPAATVDLKDRFVTELIALTIELIPQLRALVNATHAKRVITIYTSYLHHGLIARIALEEGVEVHSMGAFNQLVTQPTLDFPFHRRHFLNYHRWFNDTPDKTSALARGAQILESRLSGKKDSLTFYMKKSSFSLDGDSKLKGLSIDQRPKIVFMGHDFFDSPHIYGDMTFPDFYEWLDQSLACAGESPYQFIVKPHPNSLPGNESVFEELAVRYPNVIFLPKETSNAELKALQIEYVVTVYGTAAYEFAAMGYAVICCGMNPHSIYEFALQVDDAGILQEILKGKTHPKPKIRMEEIHEYVFVHNHRLDLGELQLFPWVMELSQLEPALKDQEQRTRIMARALQTVNQL